MKTVDKVVEALRDGQQSSGVRDISGVRVFEEESVVVR